MKRWLLLGLTLVLATASARAQEEYPVARLLTRFKFEQLNGGIVIIKATLNDLKDTLNFILDTGSGGISLDTLTAAYYKLPLTPSERTVRGIGGVKSLHFYNGGILHLPGLTVERLDFHINDYEILSEVYGIRVDGIIGYSFFRRYVVSLNYDTQEMAVYAPGSYAYPRNGFLLKPTFANIPVTRHEIGDLKDYFSNFYFDTGAGLCVMFSRKFIDDSVFLNPRRKIVTTQVEGIAGKITMKLSVMKRIKIGNHSFRKVPIHIYDDSVNVFNYPYLVGLLGSDLLRRFNLVINYPEQSIHLTPNTHIRERFDYSYTGMNLYFIEGKVMVTEVHQGSPAEQAGLQPGDIIFGINNNFSNNIQQYKNLLQQEGQKLRIILFRNNAPMLVELKVGTILR
ncbi:MAG TPA: aspartyl protease family protein [Lacibacter sp.]|nr:aspartyl protease family protein [Lacibacter sp.]HMO90180.1 aspartyl protease family protein [Lacibacter sp.]HMP87247.1 aspartyl protease family protein [Lacibacter sp.]